MAPEITSGNRHPLQNELELLGQSYQCRKRGWETGFKTLTRNCTLAAARDTRKRREERIANMINTPAERGWEKRKGEEGVRHNFLLGYFPLWFKRNKGKYPEKKAKRKNSEHAILLRE